jgi:three-Cys-motif partner protein
MKSIDYYRSGREQTYLKHFFPERYLERVGFNICSFKDEFVYVDGFSGPWKSQDEQFEDTSFMIAIKELRKVREGIAKQGRRAPTIRCVFVEKDPKAFRELRRAVQGITDIEITPIPGEFAQVIPEVLKSIKQSFSLVFIDPTGWTGFGLQRITPILQHVPGEVIVNFMFDFINRKFDVSFDDLFGGPGWDATMTEDETIQFYSGRMKVAGRFNHVTSTRILNPTADRTYFYLVYGTRHWKGLLEFRNVEKRFIDEQERVRLTARQRKRIDKTGQTEMFSDASVSKTPRSLEQERQNRKEQALLRLKELVRTNERLLYEELLGSLLELPLVWQSDVNEMIMSLRGKELEVEGLKPRERTPKRGHVIVRMKGAREH